MTDLKSNMDMDGDDICMECGAILIDGEEKICAECAGEEQIEEN